MQPTSVPRNILSSQVFMVIRKALLGLLKFNKPSRYWNEEIAWACYPANHAYRILFFCPVSRPVALDRFHFFTVFKRLFAYASREKVDDGQWDDEEAPGIFPVGCLPYICLCIIFHLILRMLKFRKLYGFLTSISNFVWYSQWTWSGVDDVRFMVGTWVFTSKIFSYCRPWILRWAAYTIYDIWSLERELQNLELKPFTSQNAHFTAPLHSLHRVTIKL